MYARRIFAVAASLLGAACVDQPSPLQPLADTKPLLITNGTPDQGAHPYVGLLVFDDADGPAWICSGSLLSSTVVLTAGHCTDGAVAARIWVTENLQGNTQYPFGGTTSYEGSPNTYPGFCVLCDGLSILRLLVGDIGIVVLSEPVPTNVVNSYVQLPAAGLASTLPNRSEVRLVGYGDQFFLVGGGPPQTGGFRRRFTTTSTLLSGNFDNSENVLRISQTTAQGKGGACFGDSGGPNLVGSSNVTIAVNSFGPSGTCFGVGYSTRIDVTAVLNWIQSFLN